MKATYRIEAGQIVSSNMEDATITLYTQPSEGEKTEILEKLELDPIDLEAIFDPDEVPRVEVLDNGLLVLWKYPDNVSHRETIHFAVSSLGIITNGERAVLVMPHSDIPTTTREFRNIRSTWDFVLRALLYTVHHYQGHLKAIKMMSQDLQAKIATSMENHYLLQMFALGESLVYYYNALEANLSVLTRLRTTSERLKFSEDDVDLLDELIIESQQASKQAGIYSTVLSGLMDARGSIVNNNMNVTLKKLTIINVIFLPLNLIAGIFGMSEYTALTQDTMGKQWGWGISYAIFSAAMLLISLLTWFWLARIMNPSRNLRKKGLRT